MPKLKPQVINQADMKAALARARPLLGEGNGPFVTSARLEFHRGLFRQKYGEPARSANELAEALYKLETGHRTPECQDAAARLTALGEVANALAALQCNGVMRREADGRTFGSWIEGDDEALEAARDKVRTEAAEILKPYGARVDSIKGDPRGHTLLLVLPGQTNRGFDGNLWGVG